jgi:hypothetical protein
VSVRVTVLGLARDGHLFDAIVEGDRLVLARVGDRSPERGRALGPLLLLLTWAAALHARIGLRRLPGATGHGLAGEDERLSRERLRLQGLRLDDLAGRHPANRALLTAGLRVRVIASEGDDPPMIELSGPMVREPLVLEAVGDPPERLVRVVRERGGVVQD